jgi:hypothetical protein
VVVVDRLIHGAGIDLAVPVAVDRRCDPAEQPGQPILPGWPLTGHRPVAICTDGWPPVLTSHHADPPYMHNQPCPAADHGFRPYRRVGARSPDPPVTLSREIGLGSILRSTGPNVSEAKEIPGSQVGSQRRQILGDAGPRPATVSAAERHIRPYPATSGDVRGMPPKQSLTFGFPSGGHARQT